MVSLYCQAWAKNIDTERIYVDKVDKNWKKNPSRLEDYYDICLAGASQWRRQLHCLLWGAYNHHQVNILLKQIVVSKNENVIFSEGRSERVQKGRWLEDFTNLASSHWFVLCMCRPVSQTYMMFPCEATITISYPHCANTNVVLLTMLWIKRSWNQSCETWLF